MKNYEKPTVQILRFAAEDILWTSDDATIIGGVD